MMKKIKKIANYKYISIWLIIISFCLAFLYEVAIGNWHYYQNDFKGVISLNNVNSYQDDKNYVIDILETEKYIEEIEFKVDLKSLDNIKFKIISLDNDLEKNVLKEEVLYAEYQGMVAYKIQEKVSHLQLVFEDCQKMDCQISDIKLSNSWQINYFKILLIFGVVYLILDFLKILEQDKRIELWKYFLKVSLLSGILLALYTPMYYSLDEKEHLVRAYNVANYNFIQKSNELVKWPVKLNGIIENPNRVLIPSSFTAFKYNFNYLDNLSKNDYAYVVHNSTAVPYLFVAYSASGLGIKVAQILNLSFPYQFYLGRIFNVIMYSLVVALAIKLSKKTEKILFVLGLLPAVLFQSGSFSADVMTNAFSLLAIGLTFYYKERKEKIGLKQLLILAGVCIVAFISKMAYFPLMFLIWLIDKKQFQKEEWSLFFKISFSILGVIIFGLATMYSNKMGIVQWNIEGVNTTLQLKYIITHPLTYFYILFNTLQINLLDYFVGATTQLGYCGMIGQIDFLAVVVMIVIVILTSNNFNFNIKDKVVLFLVILMSMGASMSALYLSFNPVGAREVMGYQGRYIIPILSCLMLLLTSKKIKVNWQEKNIQLFLIITTLILISHSLVFIFSKYYL